MKTSRRLVLLLVLSTSSGCQPAQTYVAASTVLGLHANVNTAMTSGTLQFGYDRSFATVIPRSVDMDRPAGAKNVMSVLGCSDVKVTGIFLTRFQEALATGAAAQAYADSVSANPSVNGSVFQCFQGR